MSRFNQENYNSILHLFTMKTGFPTQHQYRNTRCVSPKVVFAVAAALIFVTMAAFSYPLFSPLRGDALTLQANYEGEGIVSIQVTNHANMISSDSGIISSSVIHFPSLTWGWNSRSRFAWFVT